MATKKQRKPAKNKTKTVKRDYDGADSYMLEQSQTLHDIFEVDKGDFIAFDSTLADPLADDWQLLITAAINYKDDSTVTAEVLEKTDAVKAQIKKCSDKYNDIMYYAQKAFGKTSPILKQFGKGKKYSEAVKSQAKMYNFMDELSQAANKHKVKLATVGCNQTIIDTIATERDAFNTINRDQNLIKTDRPEISQGRVKAYNAVYKITVQIIKAAKSVYRTNPAKLGQYIFNPPVKHKKIILKGTLAPGEFKYLNTGEVEALDNDPVSLQAIDSDMKLYASAVINGAPNPANPSVNVMQGHIYTNTVVLTRTAINAVEGNEYIHIKNTGTGIGSYKLTIG